MAKNIGIGVISGGSHWIGKITEGFNTDAVLTEEDRKRTDNTQRRRQPKNTDKPDWTAHQVQTSP